jgi:anti-anti-sigma regulatory factor
VTQALASIDIEYRGHVVVVAIAGEVDLSNAEAIGGQVELEAYGAGAAVIDLTALDHMDSAGFKLIGALERYFPLLVVVAPDGTAARETLELVSFDRDPHIRSTVDDAIVHLEQAFPG